MRLRQLSLYLFLTNFFYPIQTYASAYDTDTISLSLLLATAISGSHFARSSSPRIDSNLEPLRNPELDLLRGYEETDPILKEIQKRMSFFRQGITSFQSFSQNFNTPTIDLKDIFRHINENNLSALQGILSIHAVREKQFLFRMILDNILIAYNDKGIEIPRLLRESLYHRAIIDYFRHGDCGEQAPAFVFDLIEMQVPEVFYYMIEEDECNHTFLVIRHPNGKLYAVDTYFNILCPLDEYWAQNQLLAYFRMFKPNDPEWVPYVRKFEAIERYAEGYANIFVGSIYNLLEDAIPHLHEIRNEFLKKIKDFDKGLIKERLERIISATSIDEHILAEFKKLLAEEESEEESTSDFEKDEEESHAH